MIQYANTNETEAGISALISKVDFRAKNIAKRQ